MKKNLKVYIFLLLGTLLIIAVVVLNSLGVINLSGTAGVQVGDKSPTPAGAEETSQPSDALSPSNLSLKTANLISGCDQVSAIIIMSNAFQSQTASDITVNIQVVEGAGYIAQSPSSIWRVGSLVGGQKKLVQLRINVNEDWLAAQKGTQIVVEAKIEAETTNAQDNVGKNIRVTFAAPGNCKPTETPEPTASPTPSPDEGTCKNWFVFHSLRDGNMEIYRLDGVEGRPGIRLYNLTNSSAEDRNPSRSPDGLWIAFQSNRDGNYELYLVDGAGGNLRRLTVSEGDDTNPMIGPDNRKIVYQSNRSGNWDIYLYDRIAQQETQLTSGEQDETNAFWAPNGRAIVYQTNRAGSWDLIILDVASGEETVLAAQPYDEMFPAYSPDGRNIGFIANPTTDIFDVYVADTANLGVIEITNGRAAANLAWSPDSRSLAFEDTRDGNTDIYVYRFSTKAEIRLTENDSSDYAPTWDCKGLNVYFTSQQGATGDIFQVSFTGGNPIAMTTNPGLDLWPVYNNPKSFGPSLP